MGTNYGSLLFKYYYSLRHLKRVIYQLGLRRRRTQALDLDSVVEAVEVGLILFFFPYTLNCMLGLQIDRTTYLTVWESQWYHLCGRSC